MTNITLTDVVAHTLGDAGVVNSNNAAIRGVVNGGIDNGNIAVGAGIAVNKLLIGGSPDGTKFLRDDGSWAVSQGEIAYVEFTAPFTVSSTSEAGAQTIVTAPSITFDGNQVVMISFFSPDTSSGSGQILFSIFDGATSTGHAAKLDTSNNTPMYFARRMRPSAGAHIFSIRSWRSGGSSVVSAGAGGPGVQVPGYMRISV
jgi:hypothetical protein